MIDNEKRVVAVLDRIVDRPRYLERIRPFIDVPVVKVLTGVRRCGKSTLLDMLAAGGHEMRMTPDVLLSMLLRPEVS